MPRIHRTARAEEDLIEIWLYIAKDNPDAADMLLNEIDLACRTVGDTPRLGHARPDLAPELRIHIVRKYIILYREISEGVEVVRVVHGARHLPDLIAD